MFQIPDVMSFKPASEVERLQPNIDNEEEKKKVFGAELGKGSNPFQAACLICGDNTTQALWISQRWVSDPVVLAARDLYLKTVYNSTSLLDADQLAARLLEMANEKSANNMFYVLEGKDRIQCLKLYAEIKQMIGNNTINNNNNVTFKQMVVKFVSPDKKEETIIDEVPTIQPLHPIVKLKLVSP